MHFAYLYVVPLGDRKTLKRVANIGYRTVEIAYADDVASRDSATPMDSG